MHEPKPRLPQKESVSKDPFENLDALVEEFQHTMNQRIREKLASKHPYMTIEDIPELIREFCIELASRVGVPEHAIPDPEAHISHWGSDATVVKWKGEVVASHPPFDGGDWEREPALLKIEDLEWHVKDVKKALHLYTFRLKGWAASIHGRS